MVTVNTVKVGDLVMLVRSVQLTEAQFDVNQSMRTKIDFLRSGKEIPQGVLNRRDLEGIKEHGKAEWARMLEETLRYSETEQNW